MSAARLASALRLSSDEIDELITDDTSSAADETLRKASEITLVLARLVLKSDINNLYVAFGAPGDWGYGTHIGAALADLYRGAP